MRSGLPSAVPSRQPSVPRVSATTVYPSAFSALWTASFPRLPCVSAEGRLGGYLHFGCNSSENDCRDLKLLNRAVVLLRSCELLGHGAVNPAVQGLHHMADDKRSHANSSVNGEHYCSRTYPNSVDAGAQQCGIYLCPKPCRRKRRRAERPCTLRYNIRSYFSIFFRQRR